MWKSIIYKEWLKIRFFLIGFALVGIMCIGYIFLNVQHGFSFSGGVSFWYNFLFNEEQFFSYVKFIPLSGGLLIAIAQYYPEIIDKRIKLTFHLPLKENNVLLLMHAFGAGCLMVSYLFLLGAFIALSTVYFPSEIVSDSLVSVLPWFLAGFVAYFFVALIVLEPKWLFRVFYTLVAGFFVTIYLKSPVTAAYGPAIPGLSLLTVLLSIVLLFSAYRFRKGEM